MAAKGETFYQRFDPYAKGRRAQGSVSRFGSAMYVWFRFARVAATGNSRGAYEPGSESRLSFRCLPTDVDFNLHLNNARYLMLADLGRVDIFFRSGLFALMRRRNWAPMIGGVEIAFVREVRLWQRFELVSSIETWEGAQVLGAPQVRAGERRDGGLRHDHRRNLRQAGQAFHRDRRGDFGARPRSPDAATAKRRGKGLHGFTLRPASAGEGKPRAGIRLA